MRDFTTVFRLYGIVVHKIGTLSRWALPKHKNQLKAETFLWLVAKNEIVERCFVWLAKMQTFILWTVHGTTWQGTTGSFPLLRAVAGHTLAGKRESWYYNHKAMNSAHSLSLEDDPECQVKTTVLVNTSGPVLWIPEQTPATLCWDFWSTETETINGCKIGGNLLYSSRKQHMILSNSPCWGSERLSNMIKLPVPKWNSKDCKAGLPDFRCLASFPLTTHAEKYRGRSMARSCGQYWSLASSLSASLPL